MYSKTRVTYHKMQLNVDSDGDAPMLVAFGGRVIEIILFWLRIALIPEPPKALDVL